MTTFFRLLHHDDKPAALRAAVAALHQQQPPADTYTVDPASFAQVPGSPFAYWVSEKVLGLFDEFPRLHPDWGELVRGPEVFDLEESVRFWIEVPTNQIGVSKLWCYYAKGGQFRRFASDIHLVVDYGRVRDGQKEFRRPGDDAFYFISGITYTQRTTSVFNARVLPGDSLTSPKGPAIVSSSDQNKVLALLAIVNSTCFSKLVELRVGAADGAARSYDLGILRNVPIPDESVVLKTHLNQITRDSISLMQCLDTATETSHVFQLPALLQASGDTLAARGAAWAQRVADAEQQLAAHQHQIDDIAFTLYGIAGDDRAAIKAGAGGHASEDDASDADADAEDEAAAASQQFPDLAADLLSYLMGGPFGRWDVRYATGEAHFADLPDPFAPLPVCSPAMLTGSDGLPLTAAPPDYPLPIAWDGILVDDPDHENDIVRRVGQVLELVWGERAEAIAQEACAALEVAELRDYFRRPGKGGFWDDHIKRYSKSRRKAPIYWLLQSAKKNYALWLYYHRLDSDILYKALLNYVEPKIRLEEHAMQQLVGQRTTKQGRELKQLERQIERQEAFISELRDFETRLRRVADLHLAPDLNDGVVLNIAPLWDVVPWKEAKKYWDELLKGKYEWSSIGTQLRAKGMVK